MLSSWWKWRALTGVLYLLITQGVMGQTTAWDDGGAGNGWDVNDNWDNLEPDSNTNAHHLTSASDARVNVTSAACKSFKGDPDTPNDRFLIVGGGKLVAIGDGGMLSNDVGTQFPVRLEDGGGVLTPTRITVAGDVTDIAFTPATHDAAEWSSIVLSNGGDMSNCLVEFGENSVLTVPGDLTDTELDFRNAPGATMTVGGNVNVGTSDWDIGNDCTLAVTGDMTGSTGSNLIIGTSAGTGGTPVTMTVGSIGSSSPISTTLVFKTRTTIRPTTTRSVTGTATRKSTARTIASLSPITAHPAVGRRLTTKTMGTDPAPVID